MQAPGIEFLAAPASLMLSRRFAGPNIDHVIVGGGLDLEARAAMVRAVFRSSVHMEDQMSGPEGFLPFVTAVLGRLSGYEPPESPNAILQAGAPRLG